MKSLALAGALAMATLPAWSAAPIRIVAAENFYGDVAAQIGGPGVTVTSILSNPDRDPHLFEASPSVARGLADAQIAVVSGIGYDPWMQTLLGASPSPDRRVIVVADVAGRVPGDNPHIWYDPAVMLAYARALADALIAEDPAGRAGYEARLGGFLASMAPLQAEIAALRAKFSGTPVAATEPVFGAMFDALGLDVRDRSFQLAVMNETEPSASDVAAFETDLKTGRIKLLVYNSQASDPVAERLLALAQDAGIPVMAVTETAPPGMTYQALIAAALEGVAAALRPATP